MIWKRKYVEHLIIYGNETFLYSANITNKNQDKNIPEDTQNMSYQIKFNIKTILLLSKHRIISQQKLL